MKIKFVIAAFAATLFFGSAQAANIVETEASTGKFNMLLAAAKAAGQVAHFLAVDQSPCLRQLMQHSR